MKNKSGFTLVELLVVLAVIATLVVMISNLGRAGVQHSKITGIMTQIRSDFFYTKQLASSENRFFAFEFNSNGTSYSIKRQTKLGILNDWTSDPKKTNVKPMGEVAFFNGSTIQDFAINSRGEVFAFPFSTTTPSSTSITLNFYVTKYDGTKDYPRKVIISPSGGFKIEK